MATPKKPPKKKLPTGPTKADLLLRMGVSQQTGEALPLEEVPAPSEATPVATSPLSPSEPRVSEQSPISPTAIPSPEPEDPLPELDPLPQPSAPDPPKPIEVAASVALPPAAAPVESTKPKPIELEVKLPELAILQAEFLAPATARNGNGNGSHTHGSVGNGSSNGQVAPPAKTPAASSHLPATQAREPAPALPDPRDALDAQLGLQKLTLKCSAEMLDKLGSLQTTTGLPGEILLEVLLDHWEHLPKPVQQDCLMQAHRIRVERLVISQNHTIATIEQLLNEQNLL
ncbi:hypothetical protein L1047_00930 [Synechococcus sp. Nb3U1]|uniref:hypothetical protein n=1 Tax=Synechococcus sp. Nb3U1 TaxID=1914529 RepID=UPI001F3F2DC7|nr:hypothetical protein [Synechococcus sp. Nb3U1]MCF2969760.1 hypothetical protein [Synechococcus sp. Nb3U1]